MVLGSFKNLQDLDSFFSTLPFYDTLQGFLFLEQTFFLNLQKNYVFLAFEKWTKCRRIDDFEQFVACDFNSDAKAVSNV